MVSFFSVDPDAGPSPALPTGLAEQSVDELGTRGWTVDDHFLPLDLVQELAQTCRELSANGGLRPAGVGRGDTFGARPDIRSDRIAWLEHGQSAACDRYLSLMERVRVALNRTLYLGLDEFETHFAHYAPGARYAPHLDRFRGAGGERTVSVVIYLNEHWTADDGGALRLHPTGEPYVDLLPQAGRMILFLSADLLHEVLPARRDRLSLAGWFTVRRSGV